MGCSRSSDGKYAASEPQSNKESEVEVDCFDLSDVDDDSMKKAWRKALYVTGEETLLEDAYDIMDELGTGGYSIVYRGRSKSTGSAAAVKTIEKENEKTRMGRALKQIKLELAFNRKLDHANIVKLLDVCEDRTKVHLVFELCAGGSMLDLLRRECLPSGGAAMEFIPAPAAARGLPEAKAVHPLRQVLTAIGYLHGLCIGHRDVKADNVLIAAAGPIEDAIFKLGDFGLANDFSEDKFSRERVGTPAYAAPEVIEGRHNFSCDLWSVGVLMFFSLRGQIPFDFEKPNGLLELLRQSSVAVNFDAYWEQISEPAKGLVCALLKVDPVKRINAERALKHEWLSN